MKGEKKASLFEVHYKSTSDTYFISEVRVCSFAD